MTLHDVAISHYPVGILCDRCMRRVLCTATELKATAGDHRTLEAAGVHCGRCGSARFEVLRFNSEAKAHAFLRNQ